MRHGQSPDDLLLICSSDDDEMVLARGLTMDVAEFRVTFPCECEAMCECRAGS